MASSTTSHRDDHDRGLQFDMTTLLARRRVLTLVAGAGIATLVAACSSDDDASDATAPATPGTAAPAASAGATSATTPGPAATAATTATAAAATTASTDATAESSATSCSPIPEETAGPFPADGSNGVDILSESGVVRSDIRSSFGSSTTVADGVPLTIELTVTDTAAGCAPLSGAAVYLWHCDRDGNYSMYSDAAADENYLRGVQATNADGLVTFTSIFPACYPGRWPHIHFEVYASVEATSDAGNAVATSQLALPADVCELVFATEGYEQSVTTFAQTSFEGDNVFSDGAGQQLATMAGSVADGYTAALALAI